MCKYFRFTYDYVLYDISYCNLMMLLSTIPQYKKPEKADDNKDDNDNDDMQEVDSLEDLFGVKKKNK